MKNGRCGLRLSKLRMVLDMRRPHFQKWLREHMVESDRGAERMERVRQLLPVAQNLGCSMSQMAIAWCLLNPNVSTVILGASRLEQLTENLKALEIVPLLTEEFRAQLAAY